MAQRHDLDGTRPMRVHTEPRYSGLPYGEAGQIEENTSAVPLQTSQPGGTTGTIPPRNALGILQEGPTQRPGEDVTQGATQPRQSVITASEAAFALGEMIRELRGEVSPAMLKMYNDLRKESRATPQPPIDFDRIIQGEGPSL